MALSKAFEGGLGKRKRRWMGEEGPRLYFGLRRGPHHLLIAGLQAHSANALFDMILPDMILPNEFGLRASKGRRQNH